MNVVNYVRTGGLADECARHGREHMAVMLHQKAGGVWVQDDNGRRVIKEGTEPVHVCVACLREQIPADPAARNRARALLWEVVGRYGLLHHHSSCCTVEDGRVVVRAASCVCGELERRVRQELEAPVGEAHACAPEGGGERSAR
jgi:hypothetical protein